MHGALRWHRIEAVVEPHSGSRIEYMIKAKSQFKARSTANNVEVAIKKR